ncbi:MAG: TrkH family potassium uptake protein [Pseudobutyrivibrio sp.]|nr:TrkH family potassium uptake protein [Pseudobutyrivibrio sp.]
MNKSIIRFILGYIVFFTGLFLLLPIMVDAIYQEDVNKYYAAISVPCLILGYINACFKPKSNVFYLKEGCFVTGASWVLMSAISALPLYLSKEIPSYIDALFETISGYTTTGASILSDVEALSHASLFWRSFTQMIGGMGVLVFLLAIIPLAGGSHINLMKAESPGPSVGKLAPKLKTTARVLYLIYLGMFFLELILLLFAGMDMFEAINTAMATAGTGGFGIYNSSLAGFNLTCQWIVTVFMWIFSVNFNFYYLLLIKEVNAALKMEEVRVYFVLTTIATLIITLNILSVSDGLFDALTKAAFQVTSVQSSTGFSTADFALWPQTSRCVLVLLMFVGACAGSTGGGIKVSRFILMVKSVLKELESYIHPRSVRKINMDEKPVEHSIIRSNNVFFSTFILVFFISVFLLSFENLDFSTIFTATVAALSNIGPGMSLVGPTQNFGFFSNLSKIVLMIDMLAGRLELFPILMLFHPTIWQDMATKRKSKLKNLQNAGKIRIK